jgi:hypothetical protein
VDFEHFGFVNSRGKLALVMPKRPRKKNPAAVALGRLGGLKGGKARAEKLTPEERRASAVKAAKSRWRQKKRPHHNV